MRAQKPPCPWDELACVEASKGNYLDVLRWLRAQTPPCAWDVNVILGQAEYLAGRGQPEMLLWMREEGLYPSGEESDN